MFGHVLSVLGPNCHTVEILNIRELWGKGKTHTHTHLVNASSPCQHLIGEHKTDTNLARRDISLHGKYPGCDPFPPWSLDTWMEVQVWIGFSCLIGLGLVQKSFLQKNPAHMSKRETWPKSFVAMVHLLRAFSEFLKTPESNSDQVSHLWLRKLAQYVVARSAWWITNHAKWEMHQGL